MKALIHLCQFAVKMHILCQYVVIVNTSQIQCTLVTL